MNKVLNEYLKVFKDEIGRQKYFKEFIDKYSYEESIDWNNFDSHIVASAFIYAKKEDKFIAIYNNEFNKYVYPGGHVDKDDTNVLEAAKREVKEETGIKNLKYYNISSNPLVPIDIDRHFIKYNEKLKLPGHYHYDFRYLFIIDEEVDIKIDYNESSSYKWISLEEFDYEWCKTALDKIKKVIYEENR